MNRSKKLVLTVSLAGIFALAASPAAAQSYGGSGTGSSGSYGGTSSGSSGGTGSVSSNTSSLALTGVDSADLAMGGAILAGSGMIVTWGVRRNRLVA